MDQSTVFSTLVSGGLRVTPHVISYMTQNGQKLTPKGITKKQVIKPAVAADADYALSFDTQVSPSSAEAPVFPTPSGTGR